MSDENATDLLCRELVELVSDYLGEVLSADERARFDQHLRDCPPCTEYLAQMRATIQLSRSLAAGPSEPVAPALLDVFRSWQKK